VFEKLKVVYRKRTIRCLAMTGQYGNWQGAVMAYRAIDAQLSVAQVLQLQRGDGCKAKRGIYPGKR
jgi:hypothetical protein